MTHCKASALYREQRIAEHQAQFRATMMVLMYLAKRYGAKVVARHRAQALTALKHLEERFHQ